MIIGNKWRYRRCTSKRAMISNIQSTVESGNSKLIYLWEFFTIHKFTIARFHYTIIIWNKWRYSRYKSKTAMINNIKSSNSTTKKMNKVSALMMFCESNFFLQTLFICLVYQPEFILNLSLTDSSFETKLSSDKKWSLPMVPLQYESPLFFGWWSAFECQSLCQMHYGRFYHNSFQYV